MLPVIAFASLGAVLVWIVVTRRVAASRWRNVAWNTGLVVFSSIFALLAAEAILGTIAETHAYGQTTAARRWYERFWAPYINSQGYRDREHVWSDRIVFMVGDSIPSGHGIARLDDRMGDALARKLGTGWTVATVAKPGWDTRQQFEAINFHPRTPQIIIVSYFPNDIDGAALRHQWKVPYPDFAPPLPLRRIVKTSELANFAYWRVATSFAMGDYWSWLRRAYQSPDIFAEHLRDIQAFKAHADAIGADLYFVLWPHPIDLAGSEPILGKVNAALAANGIEAIDLSPILKQRHVSDRIVSWLDPHPSITAHADAAEAIYARLRSRAATKGQIR